MTRLLLMVWCLAVGPTPGFIAGQRYVGLDCGLSPTAGEDITATFGRLATVRNSWKPSIQGGLRIPMDLMTFLVWLLLAGILDVIISYEHQARWELAASTAQSALRTPSLCEADRSALGQKLVALSQEGLFEQPPAPEDAPGQRRVVTAYDDLKTLANQYGVQQPAPLQVAQSAYDNRLFLLATAAYADAFAAGDAAADDRDVIRADYAAQYNLGLIWAHRTDPAQRQDGLSRLATACRINEQLQLGSPEACNELQNLLGARTRWPSPAPDPLISPAGVTH